MKTPASKPNMIKQLRSYFFSGLLVVAPIALTFYVVWWIASSIDQAVLDMFPDIVTHDYALPFSIPGIGIVFMVLALIGVGALARGIFGNFVLKTGERFMEKVPVVRSIYSGTKQVLEAFLGSGGMSFRSVGLLEYPRRGIWTLCFVTGSTQGEVQKRSEEEVVNVFIPTTPNPTSGFLLFVPASDVITLKMSVEDGIKMVVSAGIVTPKFENDKPTDIAAPKE